MPAGPAITLLTPVREIRGLSRAHADALAALGLTNVGRLVAHLPMRHEWIQPEAAVDKLVPGQIVSARGEVTATRVMPRGPKPRFEAVLMDESGRLDLVWFNQTYLRTRIEPGMRIRVQGKAARHGPGLQIVNPNWWVVNESQEPPAAQARLRPVYPASERVSSAQVERAIRAVLDPALGLIEDHLTPEFRRPRELPGLAEAYRSVHEPRSEAEAAEGRRRLAYDEFLLLQLAVALRRHRLRDETRAPKLKWSETVDRHIRARFPFSLTGAQDSVLREIVSDLTRTTPANRLIQGDVGSGKTVVALYAMLLAVASGQQAALLAPTELLAEQHFASISAMLSGSRTRVALLTGSTPESERGPLLARCASGEVDILVGTHALLTGAVGFRSLAVAVIDEQHRFGVHQRAVLRSKGPGENLAPHVLVMTATPIPRTLAITLFGDLDTSTIRGLPPGRRPVRTRVVGPEKRGDVYAFVRGRLDKGEQAFFVVPAIGGGDVPEGGPAPSVVDEVGAPPFGGETSGDDNPADVRSLIKRLESGELAGKRLAAVHGRLKRATRERIMERFRAGQVDALIATTVIEVGVDVPNATIMVVESADRFGLAQLHQLRGRVGRGSRPSVCVLIAEESTPDAAERLSVLAATDDGFAIAEKDLEIRGPGTLFGVAQSGVSPFRVADLSRDLDLLKMARRDAAQWVGRSPRLGAPGEALIRRRVMRKHGGFLGVGDVG